MTKSSERIEEEIDGIRERMRGRFDSAAREFSPRAIAARLTGKDDPSAGEMLEWAYRKARNNPFSTALVAAGLLGFATQSTERSRLATRSSLRKGGKRVRNYAHDAGDIAVEKADDAWHYTREATDSAGRALNRGAQEAERYARRAADLSAEYGREGAGWVRQNPTATGLFALAIGAAAASVFAASRREDALLGRLGQEEETPAASRTPAKRKPSAGNSTGTKRKAAAKKTSRAAGTAKDNASSSTGKSPAAKRRTAASGAAKTAAKARATRATKPAGSTSATGSAAQPVATSAGNTPDISTTPPGDSQIH